MARGRRSATVVAGAVSADSLAGKSRKAASAPPPTAPLNSDKPVSGLTDTQIELHSRYVNFVFMLDSKGGPLDPRGKERPLILKFKFGRRILDTRLDYDRKCLERMKVLQGQGGLKNYGLKRDFWNAEEAFAQAKEVQKSQVVDYARNADAETKALLLKELGAGYDLPPRVSQEKVEDKEERDEAAAESEADELAEEFNTV